MHEGRINSLYLAFQIRNETPADFAGQLREQDNRIKQAARERGISGQVVEPHPFSTSPYDSGIVFIR